MSWGLSKTIKAAAAALVCSLPFLATESQAMPSFARQTGMVCNSCHIGTDNVPNFTRTGRIFAMRGYTRPIIREKLRTDGQTVDGQLQYGGDYLSLNWMDFFAARLVSEFAQQSKTNGVKSDVTTAPMARMAFFYTGPITDWLGLWTEIGYLGNDTVRSVSTSNPGPTGINFYAYDEFRLSTSRTVGDNSFIGMSFGNEPGDVVTQFVFPLGIPRFFNLGQGGDGHSLNIGTLSLHALWDDRLWTQFAAESGKTNLSFSNGWNQYYSVAYDLFRQTENDLWLALEYERGNDSVSILTPVKSSFICPTTCPAGVTDSALSFTNTLGGRSITGAPVEQVKKFDTLAWRAEWAVADRGPHTWLAMLSGTAIKQNFVSGAKVERNVAGPYIRYFYQRTYGIQASISHDFKYEYTDPIGNRQSFGHFNGKNIVLLWNPAMNVSFHLNYSPNATTSVYTPQSGPTPGTSTSSSWNLGMEYSF